MTSRIIASYSPWRASSSPVGPSPATSTAKPSACSPRCSAAASRASSSTTSTRTGTSVPRAAEVTPTATVSATSQRRRRRMVAAREVTPCVDAQRPDPALRWLVPAGRGGRRDRRWRGRSARSPPAAEPAPAAAHRRTAAGRPADRHGSTGSPAPSCSAPTSACRRCRADRRAGQRRPHLAGRRARTPLRVWYAGPDKARVALLGTLGETDVIRNGRDVWIWNSRANTATHRTLPAGAGRRTPQRAARPGCRRRPQEAADLALAAIDPTTEVTTDRRGRGRRARRVRAGARAARHGVAGRPGPARDRRRASTCRCGSQVFAEGADDPAFEVGVHAGQLRPPGRRRSSRSTRRRARRSRRPDAERPTSDRDATPARHRRKAPDAKPAGRRRRADGGRRAAGPRCWWPSCRTRPAGSAEQARPGRPACSARCPKVSGAWGSGRLLAGKLFSVLLTDDGRVLGRRGHARSGSTRPRRPAK